MNTRTRNFVCRVCFLWLVAAVFEALAVPLTAQAQFGGGTVVFDPSMYARQLSQLRAGNRHCHQPGRAASVPHQKHHWRWGRLLEVQRELA